MGRLIRVGRRDDPLELLGSFGPDERPRVLIVGRQIVQQKRAERALGRVDAVREPLFPEDARKSTRSD